MKRECKVRQEKLMKLSCDKLNGVCPSLRLLGAPRCTLNVTPQCPEKYNTRQMFGLGVAEYGRLVLCKYEEVELVSNFVI
jgi:hypothetical protein